MEIGRWEITPVTFKPHTEEELSPLLTWILPEQFYYRLQNIYVYRGSRLFAYVQRNQYRFSIGSLPYLKFVGLNNQNSQIVIRFEGSALNVKVDERQNIFLTMWYLLVMCVKTYRELYVTDWHIDEQNGMEM